MAIVATIAGGLVAVAGSGSQTPAPSGSGVPTSAPPTESPVVSPPPTGTTYRDFRYETAEVTVASPGRAQSRLWYAADAWFAGMRQPASGHLNIFRLDWETQRWIDTGTLVDERPFADPDFLWTGEYLYVVTSGDNASERHAARLLRYTMAEDGLGYRLDRNFPVTIIPNGTTAATIAIDSTDRLWVAYAADGRILVTHSLEHDAHWSTPFELPALGTTVDLTDMASIVAFGPGRIGVMWSNQLTSSVYFSVHVDGDPLDAWSESEVVVDGLGSSEDRIDLKSYPTADGGVGVAAALLTSLDDVPNPNGLAPLVLLAIRSDVDGWSNNLVSQVRDKQTHAVLMVDSAARTFLVAATTPGHGGVIVYKRSPIDDIVFESGDGEPLVSSALDTRIDHGSSTKQPLTEESGLVLIASDDDTGRYLHAVVDLGGGLPPADPDDPDRIAVPEPPDPARPIALVDNDFEPWAVGEADGTTWLPRDTDPPGAVSIVDDGDGGRALRIVPGPDTSSVRACRELPLVGTGTLTAELRVRVGGLGTSDTAILSLRGSGGEAASVRVTERGEFAWFDGVTKERSTVPFRADTWYRVTVTADQAARTYAFTIATDDGDPLVERSSVDWRNAAVETVGDICLETAVGNGDQTIDIAEVQVLQELGS